MTSSVERNDDNVKYASDGVGFSILIFCFLLSFPFASDCPRSAGGGGVLGMEKVDADLTDRFDGNGDRGLTA